MTADRSRLFFALWPPPHVAQAISEHCDGLAIPGRRVARDRLHLTLAFHGVCDPDQAARLWQRAAVVRVPAFDLVLDRVDHFARNAITWVGCARVPDALRALAAQLASPDAGDNAFRAHVSVSRQSPHVSARSIDPVVWRVSAFSLVASGENGAPGAYRERQRWALG